MSSLTHPTSYWQNQKPPLGSEIDWEHPISRSLGGLWVFNEGAGGTALNLATGKRNRANACQWVGSGLNFNDNFSRLEIGAISLSNSTWLFNIDYCAPNPNGASAKLLSPDVNNYFVIYNNRLWWYPWSIYSADNSLTLGKKYQVGFTMNLGLYSTVWINGRMSGPANQGPHDTASSTSAWIGNRYSSSQGQPNFPILSASYHNRILS